MPAATTHAEFAYSVYRALDDSKKNAITSMPMYFLGSQGPDLFFFSRYMALPGTLYSLGSMMHDEKVRETIAYMKKHAVTPALHSYFMGFLTHYSLDSSCHPIINAFSKMEAEQKGTPEIEEHFRLEGEVDAWLLNQQGRSVKDYNVYTMLKVSKQEANDLGRMYRGLFQEVYGMDVPSKKIAQACFDCARITKQLKGSMRTYNLAHRIESAVRKPHLVSGMMLVNKEHAHPSVLNESHSPWVWYGEFTWSFAELMERAKQLALILMSDPQESLIKKDFTGKPLGETIL